MMALIFYHTMLCPRCRQAEKHLNYLLGTRSRTLLQRVDALQHPMRTWQDGIRMIPALSCNGEILSGITLSRDQIGAFLNRHNLIAALPRS